MAENCNNLVESLFRDVKLGLKNYLFVCSDLGGEALAGFYSIIMTCELHNVNPQVYIADVLGRLAAGHPNSRIDELLPWNWGKEKKPLGDFLLGEAEMDQCYPAEQLIVDLRLEGKVYYDPPHRVSKEWLQSSA